MPFFSLLAISLLCLACASFGADDSAGPGPRVWSGVVFATSNAHPGEPPERLRKYATKLRNIFGYNHFEIIGESSERIDGPNERWLMPSKDFALSVRSHNGPGGRGPAKVVFFQNRRQLAEFEARLSPDSPLFIRGPLYAHGQLVIVLHVMDPSEMPAQPPHAVLPLSPGPTIVVVKHGKPMPASLVAFPKERPHPVLVTPFGPTPPERLEPFPADHFSPLPGEHPGGMDSKFNRP